MIARSTPNQIESTDMLVERGYLLLHLAGMIEQIDDDAMKSRLLKYSDCIVQEQEQATEEYLATPNPMKVVH
jgi:hypothetical protein|tara:strand:- start:884 stop:1099 length:216 start_codon:yes stop_codon:yes gene_type:complete